MHHTERFIILVAALLRLCVLAVIVISSSQQSDSMQSRAFNGGDSRQYLILATNLVEHGVFSQSAAPPFTPDTIRTPGYPLMLGIMYQIAGHHHNPTLIISLQLLISLVNVWLVIKIGQRLVNHHIGLLAGLLYGLSPAVLIFAGVVMTETLFAFFLLMSIWILTQVPAENHWRSRSFVIAAGILYAMATYTRPIGLYAIPILIVALGIRLPSIRQGFQLGAIMLVTYVCSIAPWYLRNYHHYDTFLFTSLANKNFLFYNVASVEAQRQSISWAEAQGRLWNEYEDALQERQIKTPNQGEASRIMGTLAVEHILAHPLSAAFYELVDTVNSFRPGYSMATLLLQDNSKSFGDAVQEGDTGVIADAAPHELIVFGLMTLYYAAFYGALLLGILRLLKLRQWYVLLICAGLPSLFFYQAGIAGNARFRAPVEGLLAIIASIGLAWIVDRIADLGVVKKLRPFALHNRRHGQQQHPDYESSMVICASSNASPSASPDAIFVTGSRSPVT